MMTKELRKFAILYRETAWFMKFSNFGIGDKKSNLSKHMSSMLYIGYTETSWKGNFSKYGKADESTWIRSERNGIWMWDISVTAHEWHTNICVILCPSIKCYSQLVIQWPNSQMIFFVKTKIRTRRSIINGAIFRFRKLFFSFDSSTAPLSQFR